MWLVTLWFGSYISNTRITETFDICMYGGPSISATDEF